MYYTFVNTGPLFIQLVSTNWFLNVCCGLYYRYCVTCPLIFHVVCCRTYCFVIHRAFFDKAGNSFMDVVELRNVDPDNVAMNFKRVLQLPFLRLKEYHKLLGKVALKYPAVSCAVTVPDCVTKPHKYSFLLASITAKLLCKWMSFKICEKLIPCCYWCHWMCIYRSWHEL